MELELERINRNDAFISGMLFVDGKYFCQTLEREELRRGKYKVYMLYQVEEHTRMPQVETGRHVRIAGPSDGKVSDIIVGSDIVEGRMRDPGNLYKVLIKMIREEAKDGDVSLKI